LGRHARLGSLSESTQPGSQPFVNNVTNQEVRLDPTGLYDGSSREAIARFKAVLERAHIPAPVRLTRGRDIEAACGQLASAR